MSKKAPSSLESLRLAIHGVTAPFSCEGTYDPKRHVTLIFRDKSRIDVIRAKNDFEQSNHLQPLVHHCEPAPFGDGKKTRYDRNVRDALQLKAENGGFTVEGFDPESTGILAEIQRKLLPNHAQSILAELYTLNVYKSGGHFATHKDTPRGADMFGTLVVCLPSQFFRGDFLLSHRGIVHRFAWGTAIAKQESPTQLHWAAFFGDVDHQIERIGGGARVTLTYLLRRSNGAPAHEVTGDDLAPRVRDAFQALLADRSFLPEGGVLGYPCCHLYHQDARYQKKQSPLNRTSCSTLKGRDELVAATALQAGLTVTFNPYMFEDCVDETWQLERFPTGAEKAKLGWQVDGDDLERALPIRGKSEEDGGDFGVTWLEPHPSSDASTRQSGEWRDPELPAAAVFHRADYCPWGYFGNESGEVDFYTFAALHIEIPKFGEGIRAAAKRSAPAKSKRKPSTGKRTTKKK